MCRARRAGAAPRRWLSAVGRGGRLVLTSSIWGKTGAAQYSGYCASKHAVIGFMRSLALELGPRGITVNAVAPGFILTDMVRDGRTEEDYHALLQSISERSMVRRVGTPEDVAHAVAFLAAPQSSFLTAQVLTVDGGRMDYIAHP